MVQERDNSVREYLVRVAEDLKDPAKRQIITTESKPENSTPAATMPAGLDHRDSLHLDVGARDDEPIQSRLQQARLSIAERLQGPHRLIESSRTKRKGTSLAGPAAHWRNCGS